MIHSLNKKTQTDMFLFLLLCILELAFNFRQIKLNIVPGQLMCFTLEQALLAVCSPTLVELRFH